MWGRGAPVSVCLDRRVRGREKSMEVAFPSLASSVSCPRAVLCLVGLERYTGAETLKGSAEGCRWAWESRHGLRNHGACLPGLPCSQTLARAVKSMGSLGQAPRHVGFFGQMQQRTFVSFLM